MNFRGVFVCVFACLVSFAEVPQRTHEEQPPDASDVRLPSGKMQKDEILKADHEKNLEDAAKLAKMAEDLRAGIEKSDHNVLSVDLLKQTEEIEKLARRIRSRMRKF
jgi:hypothetical protein